MKTKAVIFAFIAAAALSCTHWIAGSEVRLQMENGTGGDICNLAVVSERGEIIVLVPEIVKSGGKSRVFDVEWVGEFNFAISSNGEMISLGKHRLNSGSVLARIEEINGKLVAAFD